MSETRFTDLSMKLEDVPDAIVFAIKTLAEGSLNNDKSIMELLALTVDRITKLQNAIVAIDARLEVLKARLEALESFILRTAPKH